MKITPEFKAMVKQAIKEIEADQEHERLHAHIRQRISERLKAGRTGGAFCGVCNENIVMRKPDTAENYSASE